MKTLIAVTCVAVLCAAGWYGFSEYKNWFAVNQAKNEEAAAVDRVFRARVNQMEKLCDQHRWDLKMWEQISEFAKKAKYKTKAKERQALKEIERQVGVCESSGY